MPVISAKTAAVLAEGLAEWSHSEIGNILRKHGMADLPTDGDRPPNRLKRATAGTDDAVRRKDHEALLNLATTLTEKRTVRPEDPWIAELRTALREDGLDLQVVQVPGKTPSWAASPTMLDVYRVEPLGDSAVPVAPQIEGLRRLLADRGMNTAAGHYEQAVAAYRTNKWSSANSQLRATFEATLIAAAAAAKSGWNGSGGQAIDVLSGAGRLLDGEKDYLSGLWKMSHRNGSHPGLSDEAEATFRLSGITGALTFLIERQL